MFAATPNDPLPEKTTLYWAWAKDWEGTPSCITPVIIYCGELDVVEHWEYAETTTKASRKIALIFNVADIN